MLAEGSLPNLCGEGAVAPSLSNDAAASTSDISSGNTTASTSSDTPAGSSSRGRKLTDGALPDENNAEAVSNQQRTTRSRKNK